VVASGCLAAQYLLARNGMGQSVSQQFHDGRLLRQKAPANILLVDAPVKFTHSGKHPFLHSKGALDYFIQGTQHE